MHNILSVCEELDFDIIDLILQRKAEIVANNDNNNQQNDNIDTCINCISNWHNQAHRITFKTILEHYVRQ